MTANDQLDNHNTGAHRGAALLLSIGFSLSLVLYAGALALGPIAQDYGKVSNSDTLVLVVLITFSAGGWYSTFASASIKLRQVYVATGFSLLGGTLLYYAATDFIRELA
jgi:hypothetical protein